ncbi:hypothetical protein QJS10_CPA07g00252 [Acorus calamus]|uniref:Uncharacterized protein n=1 Tax=Acorus calamus TaxID=4465 RepID=A0AAV9EKG1_ACOCL|nr:hypothetical protein QJS10_CPA07g00252 [Acorus calamus]
MQSALIDDPPHREGLKAMSSRKGFYNTLPEDHCYTEAYHHSLIEHHTDERFVNNQDL